jgi:hypothetical protein
MSETSLLLKAYYEALYERLCAHRELMGARIEKLLREEVAERGFADFDNEKYSAYAEACLAFVDERIETYNPIGVQYTFEKTRRKEALELELELDWYDSRDEFENLVAAARSKAGTGDLDNRMELLADELIAELGAFPDKSIICAYEAAPALLKLPDYIAARTIEEVIV